MKNICLHGGEDRRDSLMTAILPFASDHGLASSQTLVDVARCWRAARDQGNPVQPRLFQLLARRSGDMLAPVFDSLLTLYEAVLGRPVVVGHAQSLSQDERHLVDLMQGAQRLPSTGDTICAFECALSSTRLMIDRACPA